MAVDSNALTDLVDANQADYDYYSTPERLRIHQLAMIRLHRYCGILFCAAPTVASECDRIRDPVRWLAHDGFVRVLLDTREINPAVDTERRAAELAESHRGENDCRIVAEAVAFGCDVLLTRDGDLATYLGGRTKLEITTPGALWETADPG